MTRTEAETALSAVGHMISRIRATLQTLGRLCPDEDTPAEVSLDGDTVTLSWSQSDGDYEAPQVVVIAETVNAAVLFLDDATFETEMEKLRAAVAEQRANAERESAAAMAVFREQQERELLAVLKAKYEGEAA